MELVQLVKDVPQSPVSQGRPPKSYLEMRENGIRFSLRLIEEIALALKEK